VAILVQALAALCATGWFGRAGDPFDGRLLALLVVCGAIGGACKVHANIPAGRITMGFTVTYLAFLLLGTLPGMVVAVVSTLAACAFRVDKGQYRINLRKAFSCQALYNTSNSVVALAAMGSVYLALGGRFGVHDPQHTVVPTLASALVYYVINIGGVSAAIGWSQGRSCLRVFWDHFSGAWPGYLTSASISVGVLWAYQILHTSAVALLVLPPAFLIYYSLSVRSQKTRADMDHMREVGRLNESVITSLAMAIDAKDRHTSTHVSRVREYAVNLAQKLGASHDEVEAVRIASLLHDIGKIGIPESILCKPGKLTAEEFEVIKTHVEIGATILEEVQFPWPVVPIVRTHHERWDGLGYPAGLREEEIPLGGRIIGLVDVFDALTSERPYRRAMPREKAIEILRSGSGSQFDPRAVTTFIEMLPEVEAAIREIEAAQAQETASSPRAAAPALPVDAVPDAAGDVALLAALEQLAGESAPLAGLFPRLAEKMQELVPFTCCAVFLKDASGQSLFPRQIKGLYTELLEGTEIRLGEGISGLVAQTGEAVVNASAGIDLARRLRPGANLELTSALSVPLRAGGEIIGVLSLYQSAYNFYRPHHVERLTRLADLVAVAAAREMVEEKPAARAEEAPASAPTVGRRMFREEELLTRLAGNEDLAALLLTADEWQALKERSQPPPATDIRRTSVKAGRRRAPREGAPPGPPTGYVLLPRSTEDQDNAAARRAA
jgi:putative nucleotidyltransferase with HDIG domain